MLLPWPLKEYSESDKYCGVYKNLNTGKFIMIIEKNGRLFSRRNGIERTLRPFSSVRYLEGEGNILYGFAWKHSEVMGLSVRGHYYKRICTPEICLK